MSVNIIKKVILIGGEEEFMIIINGAYFGFCFVLLDLLTAG